MSKYKLRRLYEADAQGIRDAELIDDVGITLWVRCQAILEVAEAKAGRVRCPRCARQGETVVIERGQRPGDARDEVLACPRCGWQITWGEYSKSFKRRQLNVGGARDAFAGHVERYATARTPRAKMLAIDRLIHEFHYSYRWQPDLPTRSVGPNLIQGKLGNVLRFLDELTYGPQSATEVVERRAEWEGTLAANQRAMMGGAEAADILIERALGAFKNVSQEDGTTRLRQEYQAQPERFRWVHIALEVLIGRDAKGRLDEHVTQRLAPHLPASVEDVSAYLCRVYQGVFQSE